MTVVVMMLLMRFNYELNAGVESTIKRSRSMWRLPSIRLGLGN
jgi:hypothetical protein